MVRVLAAALFFLSFPVLAELPDSALLLTGDSQDGPWRMYHVHSQWDDKPVLSFQSYPQLIQPLVWQSTTDGKVYAADSTPYGVIMFSPAGTTNVDISGHVQRIALYGNSILAYTSDGKVRSIPVGLSDELAYSFTPPKSAFDSVPTVIDMKHHRITRSPGAYMDRVLYMTDKGIYEHQRWVKDGKQTKHSGRMHTLFEKPFSSFVRYLRGKEMLLYGDNLWVLADTAFKREKNQPESEYMALYQFALGGKELKLVHFGESFTDSFSPSFLGAGIAKDGGTVCFLKSAYSNAYKIDSRPSPAPGQRHTTGGVGFHMPLSVESLSKQFPTFKKPVEIRPRLFFAQYAEPLELLPRGCGRRVRTGR